MSEDSIQIEKDEYFQVKVCRTVEETNTALKELGHKAYFVNPLIVPGDPIKVIFQITYLGD